MSSNLGQSVYSSSPGGFQGPEVQSGLALASLITGLLSPFFLFFCLMSIPSSIIAIITGHCAMSKIKFAQGRVTGRGLALTGLVSGYGSLLLSILVLAWVVSVYNHASRMASFDRDSPAVAAQDRFEIAEEYLDVSKFAGVSNGNCDQAERVATEFARDMQELYEKVAQANKTEVSSDEFFSAYCEMHPGSCALVVSVPDYRSLTKKDKDALAATAWKVANKAAAGHLNPGDRLAIGLKGKVLYGAVMVGRHTVTDNNLDYVLSDKSQLISYFDGPVPESTIDEWEGENPNDLDLQEVASIDGDIPAELQEPPAEKTPAPPAQSDPEIDDVFAGIEESQIPAQKQPLAQEKPSTSGNGVLNRFAEEFGKHIAKDALNRNDVLTGPAVQEPAPELDEPSRETAAQRREARNRNRVASQPGGSLTTPSFTPESLEPPERIDPNLPPWERRNRPGMPGYDPRSRDIARDSQSRMPGMESTPSGLYPPGMNPPGRDPLAMQPQNGLYPPGMYPPGITPPGMNPIGTQPGLIPPGLDPTIRRDIVPTDPSSLSKNDPSDRSRRRRSSNKKTSSEDASTSPASAAKFENKISIRKLAEFQPSQMLQKIAFLDEGHLAIAHLSKLAGYEIKTGNQLWELPLNMVRELQTDKDRKVLFVGDYEGKVQVFPILGGERLGEPRLLYKYGTGDLLLTPSPLHPFILSAGSNGSIIWQPYDENSNQQKSLNVFSRATIAAYLPDKGAEAMVTDGKNLVRFSLKDSKVFETIPLPQDWSRSGTFDSSGTRLAIVGGSKITEVKTKDGSVLKTYSDDGFGLESATYHPNKKWLIGSAFGKLIVWDSKDGEKLAVISGAVGQNFAQLSPSGKLMACWSQSASAPIQIYKFEAD